MEVLKFLEKKHCLNDASFIFSSLPTSPHIRILRMPDPPRDQRTLNFQNRNDGDEDQ